jgi:hypothetical protein
MVPTHKRCSKCRKRKPIKDFSRDKSRPEGHQRFCKPCNTENVRRIRSTPEGRAHHDFLVWRKDLEKLYGLSPNEYYALVAKQNGCCAICGRPPIGRKHENLDVDHCHNTLKVRGLLCNPCNQGLGSFHDNVDILQKAIDYLKLNSQVLP